MASPTGAGVVLRIEVKPLLMAFLIALGICLVVRNEEKVPTELTVPIVYEHPTDIVRVGEHPKEASVRALVTRQRLRTLTPADFTVRVSNTAGRLGQRQEVLLPNEVDAPFGVSIEEVEPHQFAVTYDRRTSRPVPIEVAWTGEPASVNSGCSRGL